MFLDVKIKTKVVAKNARFYYGIIVSYHCPNSYIVKDSPQWFSTKNYQYPTKMLQYYLKVVAAFSNNPLQSIEQIMFIRQSRHDESDMGR